MFSGCAAIPLPGVPVRTLSEEESSFFSNTDLGFQDVNPFEPTFRDVAPNINRTTIEHLQEIAAAKPTTIHNPLEKLLDNVYGNYNWRAALGKFTNNEHFSNIHIPLFQGNTEIVGKNPPTHQGFYNMQISGSRNNNPYGLMETTTRKPNPMTPESPNTEISSSKFTMNKLGSRQYVTTESPYVVSNIADSAGLLDGRLPKRTDLVADMGTPEQNKNNVPTDTWQPQLLSVTQKPQMENSAIGIFDSNSVNAFGGAQPQYRENIAASAFDPNKAIGEQHLFRPNSAFSSYVTQTGSNPNNIHLQVAFDANAINEQYMQDTVNRLYQAQPAHSVATGTPYGQEQHDYRFSGAYNDAQPQPFNANAVNEVLMESHRNMQQQHLGPVPISGSKLQHPSSQSHPMDMQPNSDKHTIHNSETVHATTRPQAIPITTRMPPHSYNFVPGSLFPGQGYQLEIIGQQFGAGVAHIASPPEYLRHVLLPTGNEAFNPNKLNAAQNVYNPNAKSWIQTRDIETIVPVHQQKRNYLSTDLTYPATTQPPHMPSSTTAELLSGANLVDLSNSSAPPTPSENPDISSSSANYGFDPNTVNAIQGQTNFVPGQLAPSYTGYTGTLNSQYQGKQDLHNEYSPNTFGRGGATMNLNIDQLLGVNAGDIANDTNAKSAQNIAAFNPSMMTGTFGGAASNYSTYMVGFGTGFTSNGFNQNTVNQEFSNVLGIQGNGFSQSGDLFNHSAANIGGYGSFDPNAVNTRFGSDGFGMGNMGMDGGAGYMTDFDPNIVNQLAIQKPFEEQGNGNNANHTNSMIGYLLGVVSGNNNGNTGAYTSAFIAAFNPDSVNQAVYDPNKYNQVHLHLDPMDMLARNPGLDKATLMAATSAFDPDKLNKPSMQQALSPINMFAANPQLDKGVRSNLKYDQNKAGNTAITSTHISTTGSKQSVQYSAQTQHIQSAFDPIGIMAKLMQNAGAFQPGTSGTGHQHLDPLTMFGNNNNVPGKSTQHNTPSSTSGVPISKTTRKVLSHSTASVSLSTPVTVPSSTVVPSTSSLASSTTGHVIG